MNRLRLLKVGPFMARLSQDFELPSRELTYLEWSGYNLESMPSNFHAYNLVELHLWFSRVRCLWEGNMDARMLKILDLSHSEQLVDISSISSAPKLEFLLLEGCKRLKSLPRNLHKFKSLQTLSCTNCLEIKSFPEIKENMGSLRVLDFSGTGIEEVPSSIRHLHRLEDLNLSYCQNLLSLPDDICCLSSLKTLLVKNCPKLLNVELELCSSSLNLTCRIVNSGVICENGCFYLLNPLSSLEQLCITISASRGILNDSFNPYSLKISCPSNYHGLEGRIPSDIFRQSSLENLSLDHFNFKEAGIPLDNWYLPSLQSLSLHYCNLMEGEILNRVCHLSSLTELDLNGSYFSSIPVGITRLSNLSVLNLNHCENLQQIPELPLSLRIFNAHGSNRISLSSPVLQFHSLIGWFKSVLKQDSSIYVHSDGPRISISIPRSCGILEGKGEHSCLDLPPDWYKDLLGFALFCGYVNFEFNMSSCILKIKGNGKHEHLGCFSLISKPRFDYDISDLASIVCYPKASIEEKYCSSQWTRLVASFDSRVGVKEFGIHLIYAKDYVQMHPSIVQASSSRGNSSINGTRQFFSRGNSFINGTRQFFSPWNSFINGTRQFFSRGNSRDHGSPTKDDYSKAHNKRSPIEQSTIGSTTCASSKALFIDAGLQSKEHGSNI